MHDATQHALAELWREVLGLSGPIGADDDFFLLGGDSLNPNTMAPLPVLRKTRLVTFT